MPKLIMNMLLTLFFTCLAFFSLREFGVHALFPKRLSNHCQGLRRTFSEICTKFDALFFRSIAKSRQAR
jgi:hypothetical protein